MLNESEVGGVALGALEGARSATASAIRAATEAKPAGGVYAYVTMRAALANKFAIAFKLLNFRHFQSHFDVGLIQ